MSWSRLQSCSDNNNSSPSTMVSATFSSDLSSGSKLLAAVQSNASGNGQCTAVKDGSGNSFTKVADSGNVGTGYGGVQLWVLDTPAGDAGTAATITATFDHAQGNSMVVQEVAGLVTGTTGSLDGSAGTLNGSSGAGSSIPTGTPSYTSTAASEYLVSCIGVNTNGGQFPVLTPGSGSADANNQSDTNAGTACGIAYANSTDGAESDGWTFNGSGSFQGYGVILVALKLAGGTPHTATAALTDGEHGGWQKKLLLLG